MGSTSRTRLGARNKGRLCLGSAGQQHSNLGGHHRKSKNWETRSRPRIEAVRQVPQHGMELSSKRYIGTQIKISKADEPLRRPDSKSASVSASAGLAEAGGDNLTYPGAMCNLPGRQKPRCKTRRRNEGCPSDDEDACRSTHAGRMSNFTTCMPRPPRRCLGRKPRPDDFEPWHQKHNEIIILVDLACRRRASVEAHIVMPGSLSSWSLTAGHSPSHVV